MKYTLTLLLFLIMYSCSNSPKKGNLLANPSDKKTEDSILVGKTQNQYPQSVTFNDLGGQAVLIGDKIELLDQALKPIEDISNLSKQIIEILGVSDSLFNYTDNICNAFWYVKIKVANKEGVVNGRQVFKIVNSRRDTSLIMDGRNLEILTTEFFGMGVDYEGELMGCAVNQPIIIRDDRNDYFGLVTVIQNDLHKEAIWNHNFSFFELRSDDGNHDRIDSIIPQNNTIRLKIHRFYQEGENDYEVLLQYDQNKYTAEYLSFGEIKYE